MLATTLIENARVLLGSRLTGSNILVEDGKMKSISKKKLTQFDSRINAHGRIVLPGLVDGHAHLHDPAFTTREDFTSGTRAAAAGGVTTVIEMVLTTPVDSAERIKAKIEVGRSRSLIDFSFHAGMMNLTNLLNIPSIADIGVRSFKTFTCKPYYVDDHTLMSLMRETTSNRSILDVHAEDEEIADRNLQRLISAGRMDPLAHLEWKPNIAEEEAVRKVIGFASETKSRVHISHLSTAQAVSIVQKAKTHRIKVTVETCPHYLTLTRKDMKKLGPYVKMNPSLKGPKDASALWRGLRSGAVDIVTSEHAPGERSEKEIGWRDIWKAWGGVPTIETMLPLLLSEGVNKGRISLVDLQRVCCTSPAKIFGLYPRKGCIKPGADADLVIVDPKLSRKVRAETLHYKVGWTPYEGRTLKGWPVLTMLRGTVLCQDGVVIKEPGNAQFLPMSL
jgi:D-hydantoinase